VAGGNTGSIRRRRLGIELRNLRAAAGLTLDDVADRFHWSVSKASRMELGRVPINPRDLNDLLTLYGMADDDRRLALHELTKNRKERDWWHRFDDLLPRQFSIYLGFEGDATSILTYESLLVPGLLQTADYARALFEVAQPARRGEDIDRHVEARLQRQTLLDRGEAGPPTLWVIVDEASLRRVVGSAKVMHSQLLQLLAASERPSVTLQVVPFRAGAYMSMEGGFIILGFGDLGPDVACVDGLTRSLYLEDESEVARYRLAFEHLRAIAASPADSRDLIAAIAKEMK
jgi:transcriptional regulator with XRE-family HTH domain